MSTIPPAPTPAVGPTVAVTLGEFTLPAFVAQVQIEIMGQTIVAQAPVAAGVTIPAGVTGTFVLPPATVSWTADSKTITADSSVTV